MIASVKEFPKKNVSEQHLVCLWIWSMNVNLGTF